MIIEANTVTFLFLTQVAETNIHVQSLEQDIAAIDAVQQNMLPQQLRSHLLFSEKAEVSITLNLLASSTLSLVSAPIRGPSEGVFDMLFLNQQATAEENYPLVSQSLVLTHHAEGLQAKPTFDVLVLVDSVNVSVTINPVVEQTLAMVNSVVGYEPSKYWFSYDFNVVET